MMFNLVGLTALTALAPVVFAAPSPSIVTCPDGHTTVNAACCPVFPIVENLLQAQLFDGGECGEEAHAALRLAFNDAIGFSIHGGKGGGADGSILAFNQTETAFLANIGTSDITDEQFPLFLQSGLSAGDFVHLAAAVGVSNCAGAPRLRFFLGRPSPIAAAPDLTVPEPTDDVSTILSRFADAGFSPQEVVALLSAHTVADASNIDVNIPGTPFDSTASLFDTQLFLEVLLKGTQFPGGGNGQPGEVLSPIAGEMRLESDFGIAQDSRTACFWQEMVDNQSLMVSSFSAAMAKLQVLGQNTAKLVDCSDVIPVPQPLASQQIKYPASFSEANVLTACPQMPFPSMATVPGPPPTISPVPQN